MKLKTFEKKNAAVVTEYTVFAPDGTPIDDFVVDYLAYDLGGISKLLDYEKRGADVRHISVNSVTHVLSVSITSPSSMSKIHHESYEDLRRAVDDNPTEESINALGEWFERYGSTYWNGWYYDADGIRLAPIYEQTGEDDFDLIGWQLAD